MARDVSNAGVSLRVLVRWNTDKSEYAALALDVDIWGYGKSIQSASEALSKNLKALISFALQCDCISMIEHTAPEEYLERYYARRYSRLSSELAHEQATAIPYPDIDFDAFEEDTEHAIRILLSNVDTHFCLYRHRQDNLTKILYHPDVHGSRVAYPLLLEAGKEQLNPDQLASLALRFAIPVDSIQSLGNYLN